MNRKRDISISAFFPCYNEETNVEGLVLDAMGVMSGLVRRYEIIIVNDGSTDETGPLAERLCREHEHLRVVHHTRNYGYGAALTTGFSESRNDWVFFTDGDRQFLMEEVEILLDRMDGCDVVVGFRRKRRDRLHRRLYASAWNRLVRHLFDLEVRDVNCAFKLIRKRALDGITLTSMGAAISLEFLVKIRDSGGRIKEVGVTHRPRTSGKQTGGSPWVVVRAFRELFRLRRELAAGNSR